MAVVMTAYMRLYGRSVWSNPDLIAAMWLGPEAADGRLGLATLVGFLTHVATSALMGVIAVPFIYGLPPWRTVLAAFSYAIASYSVAFAAVLTWANPVMVGRAWLVPMTAAHALFGVVLGAVYLRLTQG